VPNANSQEKIMKTTELPTLKEINTEKDTLKLATKAVVNRSFRPMKSMGKIESVKPNRLELKHRMRKRVIKL
tara:strand:+ start:80208 stop:80423 length:216 start_codon:yes stop_codon:yes gene_type:complete